jgi:tRNA(His) 5'-end guanylyltransferase
MNRYDFESLGDKHKRFEETNTMQRVMDDIPFIVRLDGRSFHTFTRGLERPYDVRMCDAMINTMTALVKEFNPDIGYTQSDEITLVFLNETMPLFDGRIAKLGTILAAKCSVLFNREILKRLPEKTDMLPVFDARVWSVPNKYIAAENLLWRQADASRNSLTMAAHAHFSTRELHGAGYAKKHNMLNSVGINWDDYPTHFKRGTFAKKFKVLRALPDEVLAQIPAIQRPKGPVERLEVQTFDPGVLTEHLDQLEVKLFGNG